MSINSTTPNFGFKLANGFSAVAPPIVKVQGDSAQPKPTCCMCGSDQPIVKQGNTAYCHDCASTEMLCTAYHTPT